MTGLPKWEWAYEDSLPQDIDGKVYDFLYRLSEVHDGVRVFPWPHKMLGELVNPEDET